MRSRARFLALRAVCALVSATLKPALIAASNAAGLNAPFLSPAFPLELPAINSFAPGSQTLPAVASNGREYLVAWTHSRSEAGLASDIIGTRIDGNGRVLDVTGLRICMDPAVQSLPAIAS